MVAIPVEALYDPVGGRVNAATTAEPTITALRLITDKSLHSDLSPPVVAISHALDEGAGLALGLGKAISGAGLGALSTVTGEAVAAITDTLANAATVVPLIGAVIKFAVGELISALQQRSEGAQATACQQVTAGLAAKPTGGLLAGGGVTPADLFAPVIRMYVQGHPSGWNYDPGKDPAAYEPSRFFDARDRRDLILTGLGGPTTARSMTGLVFMQLTEGAVVDELDNWNWKTLGDALGKENKKAIPNADAARRAWLASVHRDLDVAPKQWEKQQDRIRNGDNLGDLLNPDSGGGVEWRKYGITNNPPRGRLVSGVPAAWRDRFRTLRRGIEASYGPSLPPGTRSDGGVAFWIFWLDLFAQAFSRGFLTPEFATYLLARQCTYAHTITDWGLAKNTLLPGNLHMDSLLADPRATAAAPTWVFGQQFSDPCPPMLISSFVLPLVSGWQNSVHPYYEQGQDALAAVEGNSSADSSSVPTVTVDSSKTAPPTSADSSSVPTVTVDSSKITVQPTSADSSSVLTTSGETVTGAMDLEGVRAGLVTTADGQVYRPLGWWSGLYAPVKSRFRL